MENFDLKKYLAEGKLHENEEIDVLGDEFTQEIQDDMKMYYKMDVDMDDIKDWVNMYYIGYNSEYDEGPGDVDYEGNEFGSEDYESEKKELVFDTAEREDFYMHLEDEADSTFPNLAEGRLLKEDLIDKIKKLKDYNKTEDSLKYEKYDITYDKDENLYSVFLKKGSGDSSDMPEFESSSPEKVKKYLAEGKILKENSPGYSTRKQGEALPTSESIKAAYEAKNNIKEDYTTPELEKASDALSDAITILRKASVARGFFKGNDEWVAFEKAWSTLDNGLQSKDIRKD